MKRLALFLLILLCPTLLFAADAEIINLGELTSPASNDVIPIVDVSLTPDTTMKVEVSNLVALTYFADSAEADQGVVGSGRSVKDLVDAIGSNEATIMLSHHGSATTDYTFGTNETIPLNITLMVQKGARIAVSTGITLTVYSPEHIAAGRRQEIYTLTGTGKVAFTVGGTVYPEHWGANTTPGTTDMTAEFTAAQTSLPLWSGATIRRLGKLHIPTGTYVINDWNPLDGVDIEGESIDGTVLKGTTSHIIKILTTRANAWKYVTVSNLTFQPYDSGTYAAIFTEASGKAVANVDFFRCRFNAPGKYGCYGYFNIVRWIECYFGNTNSAQKLISGIYLGGAGSANHKNTIRSNTFYYMSGAAIDMQGVAGVYCQNNVIDDNIFEQLDDKAIHLNYAWGTKIIHNYFEQLNKVTNSENCVIYNETNCLGVTNIDRNHFTGTSINFTTSIVKVLAGQQPYITLNWNQFGTPWNGVEMIDDLSAQWRFWFLGNYYTGTPTFGSDASYAYYNNDTVSNKVFQVAKPANATLLAWQLYNSVITNLGQAGGGGGTITLTLPTAAEGMYSVCSLAEVPGVIFNIKAGANDKIYLDGTALDDGDKVSNLNATAAIGDSIRFWAFETASGVYDWYFETVSGTWVDGGA